METQRASRPIFSRAAGSKSVKDYLSQLDELLRRNKGGFSAVAEETGSSVPFIVPGRSVKPSTPAFAAGTRVAQLPQPQEYQVPPTDPGTILGDEVAADGTTVYEMLTRLNETLGTSDSLYLKPVEQTADGGAVLNDGSTVYADGTILTKDGQQIYATGSLQGGGLLFSDGSRKYFDNSLAGIAGFTEGIFGEILDVTQPYGVYNPIEPSPGNINTGTDLRTKNLQSKAFSLPVTAKVLQIFKDDGTRFGDKSGHQGYGNSVLLQLPTGEVIRLSHLADLGDYEVGSEIPARTYVGTTGQTGNTYGEHLDVEYYNVDGQLSDLSTFSGFSQPETFKQYVAPDPYSQPAQSTPEQQPTMQTTQAQPTMSGMEKLQQAAKQLGVNVTQSAEKLGTAGNLPGLGIGELGRGDRPGAIREQSKTLESVGSAFGAPELQTGELSRQQQTNPLRQLAGNLVDVATTPLKKLGLPDTGFSEAIAGGKTVNTDYNLAPIASAAEENAKRNASPTAGEYASVLGQNIKDAAGYGIDKLKGVFSKGGSQANLFSRPAMSSMGGKKAVGEQGSSSSLLPGGFSDVRSQQMASTPNDIRDPFFKSGMAAKYGIQDKNRGALSLDLFDESFFQDPNNIKSVFGGTQFEAPATQKYQAFVEEQRRQEEARRQAEQNQGGGQSGGQSSQQWSQQTGQPSYNSPQSSNNIANYATGNIGQQLSQPRQTSQPAPIYKPYAQTQQLMRQVSSPAPAPQQNIFQKAASTVSNLFKKWFQ